MEQEQISHQCCEIIEATPSFVFCSVDDVTHFVQNIPNRSVNVIVDLWSLHERWPLSMASMIHGPEVHPRRSLSTGSRTM